MIEQEILSAIDGLTPALQRAYLEQIRTTTDAATIAAVQRYIDDRDDSGLMAYLSLGALVFFAEALRSVFMAGGRAVKVRAPGYAMVPFDINANGAQGAITAQSANIIKQILQGQQDAIRIMVLAGEAAGQSSNQTAKDILGTISKQTGRRTGGVLGLTGPDAQALVNAKQQLNSGVPGEMRKYLQRTDRDPMFDKIVRKAIEEKRPVAKVDIDKVLKHYAEKKLKKRAGWVSKTEAHEAYNAGIFQKYQQLKNGPRAPKSMTKHWRTQEDERVRDTHEPLDKATADIDQPFITIAGSMLMFPGDTSLGAPLFDRQNCRCTYYVSVEW